MYKKYDTYLINQRMDLPDSAEACRLISDKFMADGMPFLQDRATVQNCILFFAYANQYVTYEELIEFLGTYFSTPRIRLDMRILIDKKLIRKESFSPSEGLSRNAYCLTRQGISYILPLLPHALTRNIRPRRSGGIVPLHDYYTGISLMHFFISPLLYHWDKEVVYSNKLRPDVVLYIDGTGDLNPPGNSHAAGMDHIGENKKRVSAAGAAGSSASPLHHPEASGSYPTYTRYHIPYRQKDRHHMPFYLPDRIYIEEDMGTENKYDLLDKLNLYYALGLTGNAAIIYSMATPLHAPSGTGGLSRSFLQRLTGIMEDCGEKSCFHLYESFLRKGVAYHCICDKYDPEIFLHQFEEFLVWTGVCRSMGAPASLMQVRRLNRYGTHDFSYDDLLCFTDSLSRGCSPYVQIYMNQRAAGYSFHKYCTLLRAVFSDIAAAAWTSKEYLLALFNGTPVYVLPTKLLSNYFPHIFPFAYDDMEKKYYRSIQAYYAELLAACDNTSTPDHMADGIAPGKHPDPGFHYSYDPFLIYENFPALALHHCFLLQEEGGGQQDNAGKGYDNAVKAAQTSEEDYGALFIASAYNMAVLAQIRLLFDSGYAADEACRRLHFLLVVDEYEHALQLQKLLGADTYQGSTPVYHEPDRRISVMYILSRECGKPERIFSVHNYSNLNHTKTYQEPVYLIPASYKPAPAHPVTGGVPAQPSIHPHIVRKMLQRWYDIPGYGDIDLSLAEEIEEELLEEDDEAENDGADDHVTEREEDDHSEADR